MGPMALLKIARMGHPVLARKAATVENPADPAVQRLVDDMIETLEDLGAAGLAAPQVHAPWRVLVYRLPEDGRVRVLINPAITPLEGEPVTDLEACLSLPGLAGAVPRAAVADWSGLDRQGMPQAGRAEGYHARVLQHEGDHLNGILYPMRMTDLSRFGFVEEMRKHAAETTEESPA